VDKAYAACELGAGTSAGSQPPGSSLPTNFGFCSSCVSRLPSHSGLTLDMVRNDLERALNGCTMAGVSWTSGLERALLLEVETQGWSSGRHVYVVGDGRPPLAIDDAVCYRLRRSCVIVQSIIFLITINFICRHAHATSISLMICLAKSSWRLLMGWSPWFRTRSLRALPQRVKWPARHDLQP